MIKLWTGEIRDTLLHALRTFHCFLSELQWHLYCVVRRTGRPLSAKSIAWRHLIRQYSGKYLDLREIKQDKHWRKLHN